jgi:hypothetical protein
VAKARLQLPTAKKDTMESREILEINKMNDKYIFKT